MSPFKKLGVKLDASEDAIRAAYRKAALRWHPDVCKEEGAEKQFREITEAKDKLLNPVKRQAEEAKAKLADLHTALRRHRKQQQRPAPPQAVPPKQPPGLFLNIAGLYARSKPTPEGVFWMLMGAILDRELGTDHVTPPTRG